MRNPPRRLRPIQFGIWVALSVLPAADGIWAEEPRQPLSPSIIIVLIDTLRADYLGCYGFEGGISPFMDRFAAESLLFERCYAQAPSTLPSVATLFTSRHPSAHGVVAQDPRRSDRPVGDSRPSTNIIPNDATTLAEALNAAGYSTAAFVTNPWLAREFGFNRGFETYDDRLTGNSVPTELVLQGTKRWLSVASSRPAPFFLYLHLMDVHGPYNSPDADVAAVRGSSSLGIDRELTDPEIGRISEYLRIPEWVTGDEGKRLLGWRSRYAAGVHAVDRHLEPFFEHMRSTGVLDDAVVVVTSDHGEELCEHHGWNHGMNLYDHQLHVPLLIRHPSEELRGVRVSHTVSLGDLMITLLNIGGASIPDALGGTDLTPPTKNRSRESTDEITLAAGIGRYPSLHSIRIGKHKLIIDITSGDSELYDLDADPGEQTDLADSRKDIVGRLALRLRDELQRIKTAAPETRSAIEMGPETEERLRALGYID